MQTASTHVDPPVWRGGPWPKGYSGNPKGRAKKGETYQDVLKRLSDVPEDDARTKRDVICERVMELARDGEPWAVQWIVERMEGKAAVHVEVHTKEDMLRDLSDAELSEMIAAVKQRRIASDSNQDAP